MTRRFTQGDRNRRELEVLHRLAVELPRTPTVTGVTDLLAEHLVLATERASTAGGRSGRLVTLAARCTRLVRAAT